MGSKRRRLKAEPASRAVRMIWRAPILDPKSAKVSPSKTIPSRKRLSTTMKTVNVVNAKIAKRIWMTQRRTCTKVNWCRPCLPIRSQFNLKCRPTLMPSVNSCHSCNSSRSYLRSSHHTLLISRSTGSMIVVKRNRLLKASTAKRHRECKRCANLGGTWRKKTSHSAVWRSPIKAMCKISSSRAPSMNRTWRLKLWQLTNGATLNEPDAWDSVQFSSPSSSAWPHSSRCYKDLRVTTSKWQTWATLK